MTGLLKRAQSVLADVTPTFTTWAKRSGFKRAAILSPVSTASGVYYYVTDSFEMDSTEIARFHESADFWRETLSKAFEWQCFSFDFNELDKFRKFFDDDVFDRISKIFFLPFGDKDHPYIFVTVELDDDDDIFLEVASETAVRLKNIKEFQNQENKLLSKIDSNLDKGFEISSGMLFILSLKLWIEESIKNVEIENEELKDAITESIAKSAMTIMSPLIRAPNCIHIGKKGEIKIVLFAKDEPDEQLLAHHISRTLRDLLGRTDNAKAMLLSAGNCMNKKGATAFLTQE
ncbi:MAG: hypothetical protein KBT11_11655 [Treponema sp.]|nr:hypothetical protein [Candidatus Treponema equifaecale]